LKVRKTWLLTVCFFLSCPRFARIRSLKFGLASQPAPELSANLVAALPAAIAKMGGWVNVQSVHVKSEASVAVPVWHSLPGVEVDIEAPKKVEGKKEKKEKKKVIEKEASDEEEEQEVPAKPSKKRGPPTDEKPAGKKQRVHEAARDVEKPVKEAKKPEAKKADGTKGKTGK